MTTDILEEATKIKEWKNLNGHFYTFFQSTHTQEKIPPSSFSPIMFAFYPQTLSSSILCSALRHFRHGLDREPPPAPQPPPPRTPGARHGPTRHPQVHELAPQRPRDGAQASPPAAHGHASPDGGRRAARSPPRRSPQGNKRKANVIAVQIGFVKGLGLLANEMDPTSLLSTKR